MINKDIKLTFLHWFPGGLHQQSCTLYSLGWIWRSVYAQITKKKEKENSPYQDYASSLQVHGSIKTDASAQKL